MKKIYRKFPKIVNDLLHHSNGWLVGSAINEILEERVPRDWDIIVTDIEMWGNVNSCLTMINDLQIKVNTYGGMKIRQLGTDVEIDLWLETLEHYLHSTAKYKYIYNHYHQTLFKHEDI